MIIEKKKRHSRNELTGKEMKFARLIAEGERKVEAYMKAYDKKKKFYIGFRINYFHRALPSCNVC